ncbi:MAG: HEPN domain-containing protein [Armatimonadetes bacterium]|nr:HEPN domain-containing protein [Armatimonadota bacterium]
MPPERTEPGTPTDWLRRAWSDLELAQMDRSSRILLEDLCFHAQQAAEKALKAILVSRSIPFPRTHNIGTLVDLLPESIEIPLEAAGAARLSDYAVSTRYPGDLEPVTHEEHVEAVRIAEALLRWAEGIVK